MKRYLLSFYLSNSFLKSYKYRKRDLIGPRSNRLTTVIAEISGSGDNDVARSTDLIDACIDAGADLIKVQTLIPEETAVESHIISHGLWEGKNLRDLYEISATSVENQARIFEHCNKHSIPIFSSPFGLKALRFLEEIGCQAYKIASLEMQHIPLLEGIAATNKSVIMSTGTWSVEDIEWSYNFLRERTCADVKVMHCMCSYPTELSKLRLGRIRNLEDLLRTDIGFSDHSTSTKSGAYAVLAGARILEKHVSFKDDRRCVDDAFALVPDELTLYVQQVRICEAMLDIDSDDEQERENTEYRRSLFYNCDLPAHTEILEDFFDVLRPSSGISPVLAGNLVGRRLKQSVMKGQPVRESDAE